MGLRQCNRCTRFFDPADPRNPCWCAVSLKSANFAERAAGFIASSYGSMDAQRHEVWVDFVIGVLGKEEALSRYGVLADAVALASETEVRAFVVENLPELAAMTVLPPLEVAGTVAPQNSADAKYWLLEKIVVWPATLEASLLGWFRLLGFPGEFCDTLAFSYSVELAGCLLGVGRE